MSAWEFGFYKRGFLPAGNRQIAGVHAVKQGLIANGFSAGIDLTANVFGDAASRQAGEFQRAHLLTDDGVVGPTTARHLWRRYVEAEEQKQSIPDHWLGKLATLESANDPVAQGTLDKDDWGLVQVNLRFHPGISLAQAWSPAFIVPWAASVLHGARSSLDSWKAAVASWNIGSTYAHQWAQADYPATGGPTIGTDDSFERATEYVRLVGSQPY